MSLQRRAKKNYFLHLIRIKAHPSALSNTVKDAGVSNSSHENWSCFNMSSSSVANILNNHFVAVYSTGSGTPPSPPALASPPQPTHLLPPLPLLGVKKP